MRLKTVSKNASYSLTLEILMLIFGFIIPILIINRFGSSVYGLTATVTKTLKIINLLQAGAIAASIYSLYKPIANKDYNLISYNLSISKFFFKKTGFIYLIIVFLIAPIFAYFTYDQQISYLIVLTAFLILGINGSLSFFFLSYFDTVFSSHQQRYIVIISRIIEKLFYYLLVVIIVVLKLNITFLYLSILVSKSIQIFYLKIVYNKKYRNIIKLVTISKKDKIKNRESSMLYAIAIQLSSASPIIILSIIYSYSITSVYSVYYLVTTTILMLYHTLFFSIGEPLGELVFSNTKEYSNKIISILGFVYHFFSLTVILPLVFLTQYFINIYTMGVDDVEYNYPVLVLLMATYLLIYVMALYTRNLININGLYNKISKVSLFFSLISILVSICFGLISMEYVLLGPIIFNLCLVIYEILIIKNNKPWIKLNNVLKRITISFISIIIVFYIRMNTSVIVTNWVNWIIIALLITTFSVIYTIIISFLLDRNELIATYKYIISRLKKKKISI